MRWICHYNVAHARAYVAELYRLPQTVVSAVDARSSFTGKSGCDRLLALVAS
jgi:hypothetical protein